MLAIEYARVLSVVVAVSLISVHEHAYQWYCQPSHDLRSEPLQIAL
jgi:hypothetical protein